MLSKSLEQLMQEKLFTPLKMINSAYVWQPGFEENYSFGHSATGEILPKDKDNDARSASTLETTLDDYALFTKAVLQHSIINASTTKQMFSPQIKSGQSNSLVHCV